MALRATTAGVSDPAITTPDAVANDRPALTGRPPANNESRDHVRFGPGVRGAVPESERGGKGEGDDAQGRRPARSHRRVVGAQRAARLAVALPPRPAA